MDAGWLHVVCGDHAADALRRSRVCDARAIRVQHDVLSVGPLLPFEDLAVWRGVRLEFWRGAIWHDAPSFEAMPDDLLAGAGLLPDAAGIAFWVGGALSDQLLLPSTERIAELSGAKDLPMAVACFPGTGLGTRTPDVLRAHPAPVPVSQEARVLLGCIWAGITAPEPGLLLGAIEAADGAFPALKQALGFFLTKYPDVRSGLSRWDQELLRHAPGTAAQLVGRALRANEEWLDPVGDLTLHARLRRLADPAHSRTALRHEGQTLVLTPFGEDVLGGEENFVEHNGIDEWIAGVHLDAAAGRVWFRRGDELVPARG